MSWVTHGILVGFAFAILIGPVFFIYLQTGVKRGFKYGIMVGVGVWLADIFLLTIMNLSLGFIRSLLDLSSFYFWFSVVGGLVLILVGLVLFSGRSHESESINDEIFEKKKYSILYSLAGKGFIINLLNPFVIIYWFGISASITFKHQAVFSEKLLFFAGVFISRIGIDLLKIYLGKSIKSYLSNDKITLFQKITGVILLIFGIVLITKAWASA